MTAQGRKKAEVVIENIQLVNVYSREIHPSFSVGLSQDRIAYVGPDPAHLIGPETQVVNGRGKYLLPGFIDAHTHLDSIFTCGTYSPYALATGKYHGDNGNGHDRQCLGKERRGLVHGRGRPPSSCGFSF